MAMIRLHLEHSDTAMRETRYKILSPRDKEDPKVSNGAAWYPVDALFLKENPQAIASSAQPLSLSG